MTRIVSKFNVGEFVRLLEDRYGSSECEYANQFASAGDVGIVRRVYPCTPEEDTGLAYEVYWADAGIVDTTDQECIARASKSQYAAKLVRPIARELRRRAADLANIGLSGEALKVACAMLA